MHMYNAGAMAEIILTVVRFCMSEKIQQRVGILYIEDPTEGGYFVQGRSNRGCVFHAWKIQQRVGILYMEDPTEGGYFIHGRSNRGWVFYTFKIQQRVGILYMEDPMEGG